MKNQINFFDDIERVRGFACLIVLIHHIAWVCPLRFIYNIIPFHLLDGEGGVFIFFAISGFVVTLSLKEKLSELSGNSFLERLDTSKSMLVTFYKRRFFRIFPVVVVVLILSAVYMLMYTDSLDWVVFLLRTPMEIFCGTHNYSIKVFESSQHIYRYCVGPFWTLAIESQFYLLWPFMLLMCKNNNARALMSLILGCLILFVIQPICCAFLGFDYYSIYGVLPSLLLGSFFAFLYKENIGKNFNVKLATLITAILAMCIWFYPNTMREEFYSRIVVHIFAVLLIVFAAFVKGSFNIPIIGKIFQYLGSRSYSIYALQLMLASYVVLYTNSIYFPKDSLSEYNFFRCQLLIFFVIIFIVSEAVYRLIEKPFRELGRR